MGTDMVNSLHSDFLQEDQEELFFTELNYRNYSCLPSFVEYLEKHISSHEEPSTENKTSTSNGYIDTGNVYKPSACSAPHGHNSIQEDKFSGTERGKTKMFPSSLGPEMEFPVVSRISVENQKMFFEEFEALRSGKLEKVDFQRLKTVQDMKKDILTEQEEFQKFVYHHAKKNHQLYNFIHPDIWADYKKEAALKGGTSKYPQHYSLHETVGLAVGAVFKTDAVLTFEKTLLQVGDVPKLVPGKTGVMLLELLSQPFDEKGEDKPVHATEQTVKVVSRDPVAISLAKKHQVDVVISSSGMNCLLNNHPPDYRQQWQVPITVQLRETPDTSCSNNVVFIDKPLPPKNVNPRDVNFKSFKRAFRKLVCTSCHQDDQLVDAERQSSRSGLDARDEKKESDVDCWTNVNSDKSIFAKQSVPAKISVSDFDDKNDRMRQSSESLNEWKSPVFNEGASCSRENNKLQTTPFPTCKEGKFLVYNLWKFGKLRILIRCSVDAYREEARKQGTYLFFSVLPKLEYQCNFGHERLTFSEATRFWLHSYIRPKTKLLCGRINVFNSELLRLDELDINDISRVAVGFNPAQGMKMVFQVLQAFARLPEGKYVFSHNLGEIHGCVYKSIGSSSGNSRFAYDLHSSQRSPVIMNYTDAQIPWTAIDYNLFMPWQITGNRIPGTFPPVSDDELTKETRKLEEASKKSSKKNKKINKAKKKKQRKANKTDTSNGQRQSRNMGKLFASFYDTQPAERESEVFAVSRRASAPVTYDDIEF